MEPPYSVKFLLFTNNYPLAKLEISLIGGLIEEKISDQAFIVSFPSPGAVAELRYSSQEVPDEIHSVSIRALQDWSKVNGWHHLENFAKTG